MPYICKARKHTLQVIDICGPTPKGTGLQNMREAIIESKWKYDVSPEDKQVSTFLIICKTDQINPGWLEKPDPGLHGALLQPHLLCRLRPGARAQ